jgi:hypothetical protein
MSPSPIANPFRSHRIVELTPELATDENGDASVVRIAGWLDTKRTLGGLPDWSRLWGTTAARSRRTPRGRLAQPTSPCEP